MKIMFNKISIIKNFCSLPTRHGEDGDDSRCGNRVLSYFSRSFELRRFLEKRLLGKRGA